MDAANESVTGARVEQEVHPTHQTTHWSFEQFRNNRTNPQKTLEI